MPTDSTPAREATGTHNPTSPTLRPGTNIEAVLAARARATPAGRQNAAASVTPSPIATGGGGGGGTDGGGQPPEEGTAAAAAMDGATTEIADLVAEVAAANQAVLAPAADLYRYLTDGEQKVAVVVDDNSTSPEALLLHSFSTSATAGDIVAMAGEVGSDGIATLVRMAEAAYKPRDIVTMSKAVYEMKIAEGGTADDGFVPRLRRTSTDYEAWTAAPMAIIPAGFRPGHGRRDLGPQQPHWYSRSGGCTGSSEGKCRGE